MKVRVADMSIISGFCPKTCHHDSAARGKMKSKVLIKKVSAPNMKLESSMSRIVSLTTL